MRNVLISILLFVCVIGQGQVMGRFPLAVSPVTEEGEAPTEIDYLAYWKFEGDLLDEGGNYNGSAVGTITYEGDSCLIFNTTDGNDYVNIGDLIPANTDALTIKYRVYLDENQNEIYYIHGTNSSPSGAVGTYSYFDGTGSGTFNAAHRATDLTGSYTSDIASTVNSACHSTTEDDTWYDIVEIWHNLDDDDETGNVYVMTYIDGSCCECSGTNPDSLAYEQAPATYNGQDWVIGCYRSTGATTGFRNGAKIDEFAILIGDIRETLGVAYIDSFNINPYRMPYE